MKKSVTQSLLFFSSVVMGSIVACSPTKFNNIVPDNFVGVSGSSSCTQLSSGVYQCDTQFKVGAGKVDILFINDNSASMSTVQSKMAAKFGGFIENLDSKDIDYQIAMVTTDLGMYQKNGLVSFGNGKKVLTKGDTNRVGFFNAAIARPETIACENFIKSAYYTYGADFQKTSYYSQNYYTYCASNDERGIYTGIESIVNYGSQFIRSDAHLNVILVSNEDVRSGLYNSSSEFSLDNKDRASNFSTTMAQSFPNKYWEFNSIITKDSSCAATQTADFRDKNGNTILNSSGQPVVSANVGLEYAALSASASKDIDGNPAPRGQILSICNNDYSIYFSNIAAQIAESSRLLPLKCTPISSPTVVRVSNPSQSVPFDWQGDKILFKKGSEGIPVKVTYQCSFGPT